MLTPPCKCCHRLAEGFLIRFEHSIARHTLQSTPDSPIDLIANKRVSRCGRCLHVGAQWENGVLMVNRQVKSLWRDAVPPRDTVLPVPAGVAP